MLEFKNTVNTFLCDASILLHALQYERGASSLFINSKGSVFRDELTQQVQKTEEIQKKFRDQFTLISQQNWIANHIKLRLLNLENKLAELSSFQQNILDEKVRDIDAINHYTFQYNLPLIELMTELAQTYSGYNSELVCAYSSFLQWKERMGRERAQGSRGFYNGTFKSENYCDNMLSVIAEQRSYLDSFKSLASTKQLEITNALFTCESYQLIDLAHDYSNHNELKSKLENISGPDWFHMMSDLLDASQKVNIDLILNLSGHDSKLATSPDLPSEQQAYLPFLKSLPIFSKLSTQALKEIVRFGQIRDISKDKLVFLQGEPCTRFYIILKGWVKIFNSNESGDETILQMLSAGDTLLETSVFLDTHAPVSAQIVEDSVLLSLPAPIIRERIHENAGLAMNMLHNVSLRSQSLIHQIEQSRLTTAKDRVGWFLLKIFLMDKEVNPEHENDNFKPVVQLPYDKSIIASYLNMRPETFSRALKKLRDDGFIISSDEIEMPDRSALCNYCDNHLAQGCVRANTPDCPNPEIYFPTPDA